MDDALGDDIDEILDDKVISSYNLLNIKDALSQLHFPENSDLLSNAYYRLKFDEHLVLQIFLALIKYSFAIL